LSCSEAEPGKSHALLNKSSQSVKHLCCVCLSAHKMVGSECAKEIGTFKHIQTRTIECVLMVVVGVDRCLSVVVVVRVVLLRMYCRKLAVNTL
jgi:hypothetical protein